MIQAFERAKTVHALGRAASAISMDFNNDNNENLKPSVQGGSM
jgi:hypothetical protein